MKKYFLLIAAAATVFAVSCRKAREVEQVTTETPQEEIDDDTTPQPMLFGSSLNVTVDTKAAIDEFLGGEDLYIYGLEKSGTNFVLSGATATAPFINNVVAAAAATPINHPTTYNINVYNPAGATATEHFYYVEEKVYDFFGYYVGNAFAHKDAVEYTTAAEYNLAHGTALNDGEFAALQDKVMIPEVAAAQAEVPFADVADYNAYYRTSLTEAQYDALDAAKKIKIPTGTPNPTVDASGESVTITLANVPIDGTQDVMRAATDHEFDLDRRTDKDKYVSDARMYSSYSARRTVVPNLKFDHQMSRFVFKIKKGGTVDANDIFVKNIDIETFVKGDLTVVGTPAPFTAQALQENAFVDDANITLTDMYFQPAEGEEREYIPVRNKANDKISSAHPAADYTYFGEAMVFPGQKQYRFNVYQAQTGVTVDIDPNDLVVDLTKLKKNGVAVPAADQVAKPGYQYEVNLIVYGLEEIQVSVSLTEWTEAGNVDIDPDKDDNDPRDPNTLALTQGGNPLSALTIAHGAASDPFSVTANGGAITATCPQAGIALAPQNYTAEEAAAYNATLDGALTTDALTAEQAAAYNAAIQPVSEKVVGDTLDAGEVADYNATLDGAVSTADVNPTSFKVTVANDVPVTGTGEPYVLTVKSAGTNTVKPGTATIAITVE